MKVIPTFPKISIEGPVIETCVRVYHKGQWYLTVVREINIYTTRGLSEKEMSKIISRFNYGVYMTVLFGEVGPHLTDHMGRPLYELDPDQRSELTRMKDVLQAV